MSLTEMRESGECVSDGGRRGARTEELNHINPKNIMRVLGFVAWGDRGEEVPGIGEIFALYVASEYYGTGVAQRLMDAGLERLRDYPTVCLWVLKENKRAIRFYEKCGFRPDGTEEYHANLAAEEIRMTLERKNTAAGSTPRAV